MFPLSAFDIRYLLPLLISVSVTNTSRSRFMTYILSIILLESWLVQFCRNYSRVICNFITKLLSTKHIKLILSKNKNKNYYTNFDTIFLDSWILFIYIIEYWIFSISTYSVIKYYIFQFKKQTSISIMIFFYVL